MLKKIYQVDFLLLPDQEFWNMLEGVQRNLQMIGASTTMNMPVSP